MMSRQSRTSAEACATPFASWQELRCPECGGPLVSAEASGLDPELTCEPCAMRFPVLDGIPRLLPANLQDVLRHGRCGGSDERLQLSTLRSFGFEWSRFPHMYREWERNFFDYMSPHGPEFFSGKRILDAGCGAGRHAYYAARYGAEVWAVDVSSAVEVARRNTRECSGVHVVQADLNHLPFLKESFDLVYALGVLHHLEDPEASFRSLLQYLKPGGEIRVFVYWAPQGQPVKETLLSLVTALRKVTTRLPYRMVYGLSYPAALLAWMFFVVPYKVLQRVPFLQRISERLPMKQYSHYPFRVCVNDQFDRLSAPIENRYTRAEVEAWFQRAGLTDVCVRENSGWVASGRKPGRL